MGRALCRDRRPPTLGTMIRLSETTDLLDAVKEYAGLGLPIVPLRGKVPAVRGWQQFRADAQALELWFGVRRCNVGLRTGESGYLVIDADTSAAAEWVRRHCPESPMRARSGGGSTHHYYANPLRKKIRNRQGSHRIHGLDVRGHGGFIVLPPSVHPETGNRYRWESPFRLPSGLPRFSPTWVYERTRRRVREVIVDETDMLVRRARAYLAKIEPAVSGEGGHNRTFRAACVLTHKFGLTFEQAWPLLKEWNERCQPPWSDVELVHKLDDALKART